MKQKHCYLFALEVAQMQVDDAYDELPLHCTLMHRFWSGLDPEELADNVQSFFEGRRPVMLIAERHLLLGPKKVPVSELALTDELLGLHTALYELLNSLQVEYTVPEWVGKGYRAHVTERPTARLDVGSKQLCNVVYLIEVKVPGYDHERFVRAKFNLRGRTQMGTLIGSPS